MIETSNDASALVDEAFAELECCLTPEDNPHEGEVAGYFVAHDCVSGPLCAKHFLIMKASIAQDRIAMINLAMSVTCSMCDKVFLDADAFRTVYPI